MLLQISSAQGPLECQLAALNALQRLDAETCACNVVLTVLEQQPGARTGTLRSALLELDGERHAVEALAVRWVGTVQWICASPYRPHYPRKNWFIGVAHCTETQSPPDSDVRFDAMRSRGPGGQHVNKTSSAIRATHLATGISVRVESERSQHANRQLARQLLGWRLQQLSEQDAMQQRQQRRMQHFSVDRSNPVRVFQGEAFVSQTNGELRGSAARRGLP